ncbi:uncharacterized protein CCR75_000700 [Bremia lactucae]|uniref:Mevalonate kinase n=1 Tax=Bremia lactucae TaxID=4779 RepID=A0A976FEM2_BRELC|nr:hypothetical protein CCR75_000700 [Bremia lactucae]
MPEHPEIVRVSAPGKLLLFGEHAVVYGCPAIAAALSDMRIQVTITRNYVFVGAEPAISFLCRDIMSSHNKLPLQRTYSTSTLQKVVDGLEDEIHYVPIPSEKVMTRIESTLDKETLEDANAMRAVLFLCCALLRYSEYLSGTKGGLHVEIKSFGLPIGAGLGSSAAMSVALSGAFAELSESPRKHELEFINKYAFGAEVILHGSPSGADNTVSCYGGSLRIQTLPDFSFQRLQCSLHKFHFLLINTCVSRSTKDQIDKVRKLYEFDHERVQGQFHSIQQIVDKFVALSERRVLSEEVLGQLIERNQQNLVDFGVGHPQLDRVARICKRFNGATKLTGAGGGGCAVSLLPRSLSHKDLATLISQLEAKGFECFASSLSGPGLIRDLLT